MIDLDEIGDQCQRLSARLEGMSGWGELRAVYLDLVPLVARLQGAVSESQRSHPDSPEAQQAAHALHQLKDTLRKVGLDIRLSSPAALAMGLHASLSGALDTIDWLRHVS